MTTSEGQTNAAWSPPTLLSTAEQDRQARAGLDEIAAAREAAIKAGHDEGYKAGLSAANEQLAQTKRLLDWLARPLENVTDELEQTIMQLIADITRAVIRREMNQDPGHIVGVIREALALLQQARGEVEIVVHPTDAELLDAALASTERETAWRLSADPLMGRGEFRMRSAASEVDGSVQARLANLLGELAGERRKARQESTTDEPE